MSSAMCDNQNSKPARKNVVTDVDIRNLLEYFSKNNYCANAKAEESEANIVLERCAKLIEMDYSLLRVCNEEGELCPQYPSQLLILEHEIGSNKNINVGHTSQSTQRITDTIYESIDMQKIRDQILKSKLARCRLRFPVPVILFRGKYVCRSSTLSGGPEMYGRSSLDYLFYGSSDHSWSEEEIEYVSENSNSPTDWHLFGKVRGQDIKLLKRFNVTTIVDLMVENKKVKYGMYVTSSEKVDKKNRYSDFNLISMPYPGCEFFKDFKDNNYCAEGLVFDWNQNHCDATITVPDNPHLRYLKINWENYKQWDLVLMTQNYIKYLLKYIQDNTSGILIHCISGWDRTPLFISLLRLCLWAEGLIHQGLDEFQILYLTIAYDWMLFGHRLSDRLSKGEEIFFFCFYMLKYLLDEEFCVTPGRHKPKKHSERTEEGTMKGEYEPVGGLLLEHDNLRGSNVSLNSICSTISNKSQDLITSFQTSDEPNGNSTLDVRDTLPLGASTSPQARRTSPVTVPVNTRVKSSDSTTTTSSVQSNNSNHSVGSWQIVTATGSLRGSDTSSNCCGSPLGNNELDESTETIVPYKCRRERLAKVREIFYAIYFQSIGRDVRMGPEPSIGTMINKVVEKVYPKESK